MPPFCLSIAMMISLYSDSSGIPSRCCQTQRSEREARRPKRRALYSRKSCSRTPLFAFYSKCQSVHWSRAPELFSKTAIVLLFFPQNVPRFRLRICPAKKAKPVLSSRVCPRQAHLSLSHRRKPCLSFCPQGFEHVVSACLTTKLRSTHTMTYSPALEV